MEPPDLEDAAAPSTAPRRPAASSLSAVASSFPPSATATPVLATPLVEAETTLAEQMAAAAAPALAAAARARDEAAAKASKSFGSGMKKGFLLSAAKTTRTAAPSTTGTAAVATATTVAAAKTAVPSRALVAPGASPQSALLVGASGGSGGAGGSGSAQAASSGGAATSSLRLPEVQAAMSASVPAFKAKIESGAWMTQSLLERVAADPRLSKGLANPRFSAALVSMQKDPGAAMKAAEGDPPLKEFLMAFMELLGKHFTELGEKEEREKLVAAAEADGKGRGKVVDAAGAAIGLTAAATTRRVETAPIEIGADGTFDARASVLAKPKEEAPAPLAGFGSDAKSIAEAARRGELSEDKEVARALSNVAVVEALNDPAVRRVLDECRVDPSLFKKHMADTNIRKKIEVLVKAGLLSFQ